ncbi:putative sulfate exporter family transporter [Cellulomonas sp. APG4]|uniref:YeiH family protein n=1 Tax=Cellulomonas sp. APG4 TaxID=1538656 RepID=UPI00137AB505|nr:putative sulfate exporter family transporter [Cellulomonas sp. APG4]NCT89648.1 putative sulfate exporter family transporter [Cellulomonas sp. APG4]
MADEDARSVARRAPAERPGPGLATAGAVGGAATLVAVPWPTLGGPVLALVLGVVLREVLVRRGGGVTHVVPGARVASKVVLQAAVVLLGLGLSLAQVAATGRESFPVLVGTLAVALVGGAVLGRALGLDHQVRTLVGVGTGICGASAIATTSAVIGASEIAVATALTTIFVFNALGALLFPVIGSWLGLSQEAFGLWAGTAINDTSSVVAAGTAYGATALGVAVVVKLTRTLAIVPIAIGLAVGERRRMRAVDDEGTREVRWWRLVPPFLVLFLVATAVNSTGVVPGSWQSPIAWLARLLTAVAMAGVGLLTPVEGLRRAGWRPLALGGLLALAVAGSSLALQAATGLL